MEHGFESSVESFKGIVCPGEVVNGPEVNVTHIHVESRFPSCRVSRFFAFKDVLKKFLMSSGMWQFTSICLYQDSTCKGGANASSAKRRIARLNSLSSR